MRQIALINKFPLFLLLAGICTFALSCSSDDGDVINDNNEDIAVDFFLSNEQGEKATSFKSDENIYFDFSLVSNGKKDVKEVFVFPQYMYLFQIFDIYGNPSGFPWDKAGTISRFISDGNIHLQTCWKVRQTEKSDKDWEPFVVSNLKEPLTPGDYYAQVFLLIENELKIFNANFKINP